MVDNGGAHGMASLACRQGRGERERAREGTWVTQEAGGRVRGKLAAQCVVVAVTTTAGQGGVGKYHS
jgi:hypothetical protein